MRERETEREREEGEGGRGRERGRGRRMGTTDLGMIWRRNVYLTVVDGYVLMWGVACRRGYIGKWGSGVGRLAAIHWSHAPQAVAGPTGVSNIPIGWCNVMS